MFEDELAMEAFSRRPSHVAQHDILRRLSASPSQVAKNAADLLIRQYPEQKMETRKIETRALSFKVPLRGASSSFKDDQHFMDFSEADYDDLQRDSNSDDSDDDENMDSD